MKIFEFFIYVMKLKLLFRTTKPGALYLHMKMLQLEMLHIFQHMIDFDAYFIDMNTLFPTIPRDITTVNFTGIWAPNSDRGSFLIGHRQTYGVTVFLRG